MPARVLTGSGLCSVMHASCMKAMRYIPASCTHIHATTGQAHLQTPHGVTFPTYCLGVNTAVEAAVSCEQGTVRQSRCSTSFWLAQVQTCLPAMLGRLLSAWPSSMHAWTAALGRLRKDMPT